MKQCRYEVLLVIRISSFSISSKPKNTKQVRTFAKPGIWFKLIEKLSSFENQPHRIVRKNYNKWDLKPLPHQPVACIGFEFVAVLCRRADVEPLHYHWHSIKLLMQAH